jgi:hypothetical protein
MTNYLISIYQPDGDPPPPEVLGPIMAELETLRAELKRTGAWVFTTGLGPPDQATVLRFADGVISATDGPYAEGKEHIGGFTIVKADDLDSALAVGRRMAEIIGLPIEVRPLADVPGS